MTTDDIIRMAREAGFYGSEILGEHDYDVVGLIADLERFAALVTAAKEKEVLDRLAPVISIAVSKAMIAEREACAKLCDELATQAHKDWKAKYNPHDDGRSDGMYECFEAIRARGHK
jgi:hypothetical protein